MHNKYKDLLDQNFESFIQEINQINDEKSLENLKNKYLSRHGIFSVFMNEIKNLDLEEKKISAPILQKYKSEASDLILTKELYFKDLKIKQIEYAEKNFDITAYKKSLRGSLHPHTHIISKVQKIFLSMGYEIAYGPELETQFYNFEALNIHENHPARDAQDTFWVNLPNKLLRTHTSSVEIRYMEGKKPPFALISSGRCYRNEATDATHDFLFMQVEGLVVDKKISLANLISTLRLFLQNLFETSKLQIKVRPSYFPFVEPGIEIDMSCIFCSSGCSICKKTGWIEIGGAGLTHPNVLKACGINSDEYSGFAFGMGLTRIIMLKFGIKDIRLLHGSKLDFLKQF